MSIIRKFLDKFRADKDKESMEPTNELLTNQVLLEELSSHFESMLKTESVGQRMLYPMSFNILMDPADYHSRLQSLPFVLPEVVAAFYRIIDRMRKTYPNYEPPARYWFFQFSSCQLDSVPVDGSAPLLVRRGHITTVATLMTFDINEANNTTIDTNTRVSIKLDDSNVMNDVNVNWNAIKNLDIISDDTFTYRFDMSLNQNTQDISRSSNTNGVAELSYSHDGKNYRYEMKDNLINISGKKEKRKGSSFFIIEEEDILDSHIQIRYTSTDNQFQIAAFGPARLNSGIMEQSDGGNVRWYNLADNSSIFINDKVRVTFKKRL